MSGYGEGVADAVGIVRFEILKVGAKADGCTDIGYKCRSRPGESQWHDSAHTVLYLFSGANLVQPSTGSYLSTRCLTQLIVWLSLPPAIMAHALSPSAPHPDFSLIFNVALDAYRERTKQNLVYHPLFSRLQDCGSSNAVITVLLEQIPGFTHTQNTNGRFTKWLVSTVNVLFVFSGMLGEGVGLVCVRILRR